MSGYEPPAEMVADMQRELEAAAWNGGNASAARFVLRRQHERERGLLALAQNVHNSFMSLNAHSKLDDLACEAKRALAAHAKLDAPKEDPIVNLRGAVDQIERECPGRVIATLKDSQAWQVIQIAARGKAAVEREERERT